MTWAAANPMPPAPPVMTASFDIPCVPSLSSPCFWIGRQRSPSAAKHLAEKSFQDKLRAALQEHFGRPVRLTVRVGETGGNTARDRAAAAISQDEFVRDLVENFDATIVESSIKPAQ